jgi:hypothetical protein
VIGSGKTGIDACLWLLQNGVPPGRIRWIMPRDAWLLNRAHSQPGAENFETSMGAVISQFETIAEASSLPDLFHRLEAADLLLRMDPDGQAVTRSAASPTWRPNRTGGPQKTSD